MGTRLWCVVVLVLAVSAPARAQNCITQNGVQSCANPLIIATPRITSTAQNGWRVELVWDAPGSTLTAWKLNVTDTNSATASLLVDLQVGGTSKFSVSKAGAAVAGSLALGSNPAATGALRLSNGATVADFVQGKTTGGTDVHMLSITNADNVAVGSASTPSTIRTSGAAPTLSNNGWWWVESDNGAITGTSAALMSRFNTVQRLMAPSLRAVGRSTAQTAAVASVSAFTVGAADASFEVSANVLVTTATTHSFTVTCTYTDEGNTSRTVTLNFFTVAGTTTIANTIANAAGAVPYLGIPIHIRAKAATAITIATTGTFTTVTYNAEGIIQQIG